MLDAAAGGSLMSKHADEGYNLIEEMASNSYQWGRRKPHSHTDAGEGSVQEEKNTQPPTSQQPTSVYYQQQKRTATHRDASGVTADARAAAGHFNPKQRDKRNTSGHRSEFYKLGFCSSRLIFPLFGYGILVHQFNLRFYHV
ncbi:hypothetical protein SLEP1_g51775 [Rubroshorea leprosula]|uniref:Uncharacterized protein n=1 Tax=Rubroshorea leprosula TaxID=152421 RepID=A0AAV5M4E9_9ROSI|nr:hypothetical protein SLEP1_g51775 [Rubroshorea leprosula]